MANKHEETPEDYPALGRWLMFLDEPKNIKRIIYGIYAICAALFAMDFFYHKKAYVEIENYMGFYMIYGFIMCAALVICAKIMRVFLMRDEAYYSPKDTESEMHPDHDLRKESVND
jgi:hypothetical protein